MKKRIFALLLAAMMTAAVFTGCSSRDNSNSDAQNNTQTQQPAEPAKPEETKKDVSVDDVVKAHIKALRQKLSETNKEYIINVWGVGYRFHDEK